jgi:TRAP transporter 4TM/12TM fusion protein
MLDQQDEKLSEKNSDSNGSWTLLTILAVAFSLFHLYTAEFGILPGMLKQKAVHLTGALILIFLKSVLSKKKRMIQTSIDILLLFLSFVAGTYIIYMDNTLSIRSGTVYPLDIFFGITLVILILEAMRRVVGLPIVLIAIGALGYCHFGDRLPDIVGHSGLSVERIYSYMLLTTDGIFGVAIQVSSSVIVLFIIFGAFLKESGAGDYFTELAYGLFGRVRGGPAKIAVVASSLFGMISGSAVANVVGTGTFTIPLMKKVGYRPAFAGAVEAVASTGGQIMPPIMGASAFLMAEILGVSYVDIMKAAIIPALLYYFSVFIAIDLEAKKLGLIGMSAKDLPNPLEILKKCWIMFICPIILIYLLVVIQWSPSKAAFWSIVSLMILTVFKKQTRMDTKKVMSALKNGAMGTIEVAIICAAAGIIIGAFSLSGLGLKLSNILISLSGGNLLLLLFITMVCSLVLGMGLPTVACYIILAVLVAPALIKFGINPMAAHMYMFYFGIISNITPPVAVAAYAGAGIAGAAPFTTGWVAFRLGIAGFIVPYMFVLGPALLLQGRAVDVILAVISSTVGIYSLGMAFEGVFIKKLKVIERIILFASSLFLIKVGLVSDLIGYALVSGVLLFHWYRNKRAYEGN